MQPAMSRMILVSNTSIPDDKQHTLKERNIEVITRKNKGFDFGAWKDVLLNIGHQELSRLSPSL
jgi:rhamnosyltransferase